MCIRDRVSVTPSGSRPASSRTASGPTVEVSIQWTPGRSAGSTLFATARRAAGSASMVMTRSASRTASAGVTATAAPASASGRAFSGVRFHTVSPCPWAIR